eukprot:NODE_79_length_23048_cov_0.747614.p17 type:complete len:121 gc:universal NODE_79_length_23048_cov_0.747614:11495-11857(+)
MQSKRRTSEPESIWSRINQIVLSELDEDQIELRRDSKEELDKSSMNFKNNRFRRYSVHNNPSSTIPSLKLSKKVSSDIAKRLYKIYVLEHRSKNRWKRDLPLRNKVLQENFRRVSKYYYF